MDEKTKTSLGFATRAIHAGFQPDKTTGAMMPPIYMTTTFAQKSPGEPIGDYEYTRAHNPNFTFLEETLASLESANYAVAFSSGIGGLTAFAATLEPGDLVIALNDLYGGTYRLFTREFSRYGIHFLTIDVAELETHLKKNPKWLLFETPTNPLLKLYDIQKCVDLAHKYNTKVIVDNTFATPYFQNPILLGADVVWHSATKYLGGHSDAVGGAMITNDPEIHKSLLFHRMSLGVNPSPFDTWLTLRGIKTLALRMEQHQKNALALVRFLESHPKVKNVYYPKGPIANKQMSGCSGMVSVEFNLSLEEIKRLISSFKVFTLAESLGGVESLVNHPALMTHASIPLEEREKIGVTDSLVRFSCGIEESRDLIEDVRKALEG
ncbi:MAG: PLP-dependent aspartate aminotransferase family protein [Waddliaceae bacterium]